MSTNRVLYVFTVLALAVAAAAVTLHQVAAMKATIQPRGPQSSGKGLSALSAHADALNDQPQADRFYDQIETERSLVVGDRSYDLIETERGSQIGLAGVESSSAIDSATRSYMAWAKAVEEQSSASAKVDRSFHTPQTSNYGHAAFSLECLDNECAYQLSNGQRVR